MFRLNTERLQIIPLDIELFRLLKDNPKELDKRLGVEESYTEKYYDEMEVEIDKFYARLLKLMEEDPYNFTWFTLWQIVNKDINKIIGTCGYSGMPDDEGIVEIAYVLKPSYHGKGYMSEVLREFLRFTFIHPEVMGVIVKTNKDSIPSQKLLQRLGFDKDKIDGNTITWKLERFE